MYFCVYDCDNPCASEMWETMLQGEERSETDCDTHKNRIKDNSRDFVANIRKKKAKKSSTTCQTDRINADDCDAKELAKIEEGVAHQCTLGYLCRIKHQKQSRPQPYTRNCQFRRWKQWLDVMSIIESQDMGAQSTC